jgi:hypothetical protein
VKWDRVTCGQDITGDISIAFYENQILHGTAKRTRQWAHQLRFFYNKLWRFFNMNNVRNEIKAQIVRAGFTMQDVVDKLAEDYGWSDSVSNLSAKLQRESIRYKEVIELADVLGYDIVWQKRRER